MYRFRSFHHRLKKLGAMFRIFHQGIPVAKHLLMGAVMLSLKGLQHCFMRCTKEACNRSMSTVTQIISRKRIYRVEGSPDRGDCEDI